MRAAAIAFGVWLGVFVLVALGLLFVRQMDAPPWATSPIPPRPRGRRDPAPPPPLTPEVIAAFRLLCLPVEADAVDVAWATERIVWEHSAFYPAHTVDHHENLRFLQRVREAHATIRAWRGWR